MREKFKKSKNKKQEPSGKRLKEQVQVSSAQTSTAIHCPSLGFQDALQFLKKKKSVLRF